MSNGFGLPLFEIVIRLAIAVMLVIVAFTYVVRFALLAVLMWQLSSLSRTAPEHARPLIFTVLICEIFMSLIGWLYFFAAPGVTSLLIAVCLVATLFTLRRGDQASLASGMESKAS